MKKTIGLLLTMVLIFNMAMLVSACEKREYQVEPTAFDVTLLQQALDNVTPDALDTRAMGVNFADIDFMDDANRQLMRDIVEELLAHVNALIMAMTQEVIASTNLEEGFNRQLVAPIALQHDLFEGFTVSVDFDGLVFTNINYSLCIFAFEEFLNPSFAVVEYDNSILPRNPYNRLAFGTTPVECPWMGHRTATLRSDVRYFRRDDGAFFIRAGSHWPSFTIYDHRMVSSIFNTVNSIISNGTVNAFAMSGFTVNVINPNTLVVGPMNRDVTMRPRQ